MLVDKMRKNCEKYRMLTAIFFSDINSICLSLTIKKRKKGKERTASGKG
jgi:hypothetical protein